MEIGNRKDPFEAVSFDEKGNVVVLNSILITNPF